jgi:hypothetical protein
MVAEGRIRPAEGDLLYEEPLSLPPGTPLLSEILAEQRRDER